MILVREPGVVLREPHDDCRIPHPIFLPFCVSVSGPEISIMYHIRGKAHLVLPPLKASLV